jgi:hypothetical protein
VHLKQVVQTRIIVREVLMEFDDGEGRRLHAGSLYVAILYVKG